MLTKPFHWIIAIGAVFAALALWASSLPVEAHAMQSVSVSGDNFCLSCHEDLYYLHDTGCWYCMSEPHRDRCTDCHEGNPSAVREDAAHLGMLAHPQENDGAKCLECHEAGDAQMRLAKFESYQGFETVIHAEPYMPLAAVKTGSPEVAEPNPLTANPGWLVFGFIMFGVWLGLVLRS